MREIKFRAWDKKNKRICNIEQIDFNQKYAWISWHKTNTQRGYFKVNFNEIELMQFVGLHDKNSKEIYEGDIVKSGYDENINWEVYYEDAKFWLRNKLQDREYGDMNTWDDVETRVRFEECEVIGNIMENPELLNVEKN